MRLNRLLPLLIFAVGIEFTNFLDAQAVVQHVTGSIPGVTQTQSANITPVGPTSLAFTATGPSSITMGVAGNFTLAMAASNPARPSPLLPAGYQFNVVYTTADWTSVVASVPAALTTLGKSVTCNTPAPPAGVLTSTMTCIVVGINQTVIPSGAVALIAGTPSPAAANKTSALTFNAILATNLWGNTMANVTMPATPLTVTLVPPFTLACAGTVIEIGEQVNCTVTLAGAAPSVGTLVTLTEDAGTKIILPTTQPLVPAATTSVVFFVTGGL